MQQISTKFW